MVDLNSWLHLGIHSQSLNVCLTNKVNTTDASPSKFQARMSYSCDRLVIQGYDALDIQREWKECELLEFFRWFKYFFLICNTEEIFVKLLNYGLNTLGKARCEAVYDLFRAVCRSIGLSVDLITSWTLLSLIIYRIYQKRVHRFFTLF